MSSNREPLSPRKPFITIGAAIGCAIALMSVLGVILYLAVSGHHNSNKNCQAALDVRDAVSFILQDARTQTPPTAESNKFYDRAEVKLKNVKCKR